MNGTPVVPWIASGVGIKHGHAFISLSLSSIPARGDAHIRLADAHGMESRPVEEIFQYAFVAAAPNSNIP